MESCSPLLFLICQFSFLHPELRHSGLLQRELLILPCLSGSHTFSISWATSCKNKGITCNSKSLKTGEHLWWKRTLRICRNVLLKFVISQTILLVPANIAFVTNITVLSTRILLPSYWYESHVFFHQIFFQVCGQKSPFHVVLDLKHIQCLFLAHFVLQAGSMLVRIKHF